MLLFIICIKTALRILVMNQDLHVLVLYKCKTKKWLFHKNLQFKLIKKKRQVTDVVRKKNTRKQKDNIGQHERESSSHICSLIMPTTFLGPNCLIT